MIDRNIGKTRETKPHGYHKHGQEHEEPITQKDVKIDQKKDGEPDAEN